MKAGFHSSCAQVGTNFRMSIAWGVGGWWVVGG